MISFATLPKVFISRKFRMILNDLIAISFLIITINIFGKKM